MKVGIIGYGGVGKSTIFSVLSGKEVPAHARAERHLATVDVVDPRLDRLREIWQPRKFTRARFEVEDYPGLPRENVAGKGELVRAYRDCSALLLVVGAFEQARMALPEGIQEPAAQLAALREDLLFFDLEAVENRIGRLQERIKKGAGDRAADGRTVEFLQGLQAQMEEGGSSCPAREDRDERRLIEELGLFQDKAQVVVLNGEEGAEGQGPLPGPAVELCAPIEWEIAQLEGPDRAEFMESYDLVEPGSERLTREAYRSLDLISFFTQGEDEVRAWPIRRGSDAVTAAGKIHTDLARGFIRAEVTPFEQVREAVDVRDLKARSKPDLKGKDYGVEDGDILNIRFSV